MDAHLRRLLNENEQLRAALSTSVAFAALAEARDRALREQRESLFRQLEAENEGLRGELARLQAKPGGVRS